MLPAVFLTVLTAARVYGFNSCLEQRSSCLRNPSCRRIFESFEHTCGYSLTRCSAKSPSDCVNDIRKIRDFFPFATCVCYETIGFTEECDYFRQLIWNHPCERKLTDAGIERRLLESQIPSAFTVGPQLRRTTRTPLSDQVRQWKSQLNGDLETRERISQGTCDHALNHVCLRHVSCRQLWKLFRSSCGVDQENQCTMADREVCWQSFEGLSWTGLGSCRCDSDNSDCHWIRLHTNYNKCIYEISKSGQFPRLTSLRSQQNAQQYQRRYETEYRAPGRVAPTLAPTRAPTTTRRTTTSTSTTTTTTPRPTTTTTTSTTSTTTTTQRPTTTTRYIPVPTRRPVPVTSRPTTVPSWWNRPANNQPATTRDTRWGITAQIHYRPLFEELPKSDPVTTAVPNYYHYTTVTTPTPWWITPSPTIDHYHSSYRYPANSRSRDRSDFRQADSRTRYNQEQGSTTSRRIEFPVKFAPRTPARVSTCQSATAKCEQTETCRWHLGELRVRCARVNCRRDECAAALQRFSRYVPFELVESIMFCECEANDSECARQQITMKFVLLFILMFLCGCDSNNKTWDVKREKRKIFNAPDMTDEEMRNEAPWVVSVHYRKYDGQKQTGVCTGSLISPRHVLTAAHCLEFHENVTCDQFKNPNALGEEDMARFKVHNWYVLVSSASKRITNTSILLPVWKMTFAYTAHHRCKSYQNALDDIMLLELPDPTDTPVLPLYRHPFDGVEILRHYGYGAKFDFREGPALRKHNVTTVGYNQCTGWPQSKDNWFCVVGQNTMGCPGDSGGPAVMIRQKVELVGFFILTRRCQLAQFQWYVNGTVTENNQMIFLEVFNYLDWICKYSGICLAGIEGNDERPTGIRKSFHVPGKNP